MTIVAFLLIAALIACVVSAIGKCPLWVSVLLAIVAEMVSVFGGGPVR